jgi:NAD-dependent deacetylase
MTDELEQVAAVLSRARRVLVVTGAGMSADAGLPTYRGTGGLYADADTEDGVSIEVALSGEMLRARPEVCWRHIRRIEEACRGARPHAGHEVLARWQDRCDLTVLTQNVDGLHQAAGSRDVIEVHGTVRHLTCPGCGWAADVADYTGLPPVPTCPACGAVIRPAVVLFGEMLPEAAVARMWALRAERFDVVLSIGTTAVFPYIVAPVVEQVRRGGVAVEIDPGDTALSARVTHKLRMGAAAALTALAARMS